MYRFAPPLYLTTYPKLPPVDPDRQHALEEALASLGRETSVILPAGLQIEIVAPSQRSFAARTGLGWTGAPYLRLAGIDPTPRAGLRRATAFGVVLEQLRARELQLTSPRSAS